VARWNRAGFVRDGSRVPRETLYPGTLAATQAAA
jgi:hypothetical protein